jgi:hypothetical protein
MRTSGRAPAGPDREGGVRAHQHRTQSAARRRRGDRHQVLTQEMLDFCAQHAIAPAIEVIAAGRVDEA